MDALCKVHLALRPGGLLLDIQPEPEGEHLEVATGDRLVHIGEREKSRALMDRIRAARAACAALVDARWFVREREEMAEFVCHADSVDAWLAHRAAKGCGADLDADLLARARALLPPGGELRIRERVTATRLRRVERPRPTPAADLEASPTG